MFGSQVMNQSTENGSMPLGGEQPRISRYSRASRSWLRPVSACSTCRRAPSVIIELASRISSASCETLLVAIAPSCSYLSSRRSGQLFDRLARQQDGGVRLLQGAAQHVLCQGRQEAVIVEAKSAQQRAGVGQLHQLGRR
ncbi:Uncharacterised protein [Bordetella pertussis]|nr:Uncharacterised protein [Bordetella pertussis]CFP66720.1 Uncharacterised protein [Bordetella pertussis]CFW43026.1 Uncharacterised protein [Bordetella pertussis]